MSSIFVSASLQRLAYGKLDVDSFIHSETGICDQNRYFLYEWYEEYPLYEYPDYRYMKFFAECKLSETSKYSL